MLDGDFVQAESFLIPAPGNKIDRPVLGSIPLKVISTERRRLDREGNRSPANLKIVGENSSLNNSILPQVVNISEEGACIFLRDQLLLPEQKIIFRMELINNIPTEIPCQVMWNKPNAGKIFSGLKFFELKRDALLNLRKFLKKRKVERKRVTFQVYKVETSYGIKTKNLRGEMVNISKNGMGVVLNEKLNINSNIRVFLDIDNNYYNLYRNRTPKVIDISARILWSKYISCNMIGYGTLLDDHRTNNFNLVRNILNEQEKVLLSRSWNVSHPKFNFPSLPISSSFFVDTKPTALSVDITNQCNLKCKHCFWGAYNYQLTNTINKNVLTSVKRTLRMYPSVTNITWYGGEPLISKETIGLLEEGLLYKKNNLVVTNGTFAIPEWKDKNVHFAVSLDGTKEIYGKIRNNNLYDLIKKNIIQASKKGTPVALLYCLNALNIDCVSDFLEEWAESGIIGIVFTVYVSIKGKGHAICLNDKKRDSIVDVLMKMKDKYNKLIVNTPAMIELIRSKYDGVLAQSCPMNAFNKDATSIHMCNDGTIRLPCALGSGAHHLGCRSVTKVALYAGKYLNDKSSYLSLLRMYHSKSHKCS